MDQRSISMHILFMYILTSFLVDKHNYLNLLNQLVVVYLLIFKLFSIFAASLPCSRLIPPQQNHLKFHYLRKTGIRSVTLLLRVYLPTLQTLPLNNTMPFTNIQIQGPECWKTQTPLQLIIFPTWS